MTIQPISPLRQRMIEDMTIRRLKERTQDFYLRSVTKYAQHFRTSPAKLDYEHVREYQLHLVQSGWKPSYVNHAMSGLRFFYKVTMGRHDALEMIALAREPPNSDTGGSGAPDRGGPFTQVPLRLQYRLRRGPAVLGVGVAQGLRHRQCTHGAAHRGRQGRQGPPG
jgi:hypothetical protein